MQSSLLFHPTNNILVLALGNDILGDDAAGLIAARELDKRFREQIEIIEAPVAGFALLDFLAGYERALILDSVIGTATTQGTVRELMVEEFRSQSFSSPHYVGLKEIMELARCLDIDFPSKIRILSIEVSDPFVLHEGLSTALVSQIPHFVDEAARILQSWGCDPIIDSNQLKQSADRSGAL